MDRCKHTYKGKDIFPHICIKSPNHKGFHKCDCGQEWGLKYSA